MAGYGIIVNLNRCTGCMTCVIACKQENLTRPGVWWNRVLALENASKDRITYLRYGCMHCGAPPCMEACRGHAIYRRADGVVLIDHDKCIGKGDCVAACPYGVIDLNPDTAYFQGEPQPYESGTPSYRRHPVGKASKCTLCAHRIDQGKEPACVAGCPSNAMIFGDLDDPSSPVRHDVRESVQLLASENTRPKVSYLIPEGLFEDVEDRILEYPKMEI